LLYLTRTPAVSVSILRIPEVAGVFSPEFKNKKPANLSFAGFFVFSMATSRE
jgi:hypothetical protein